MKSVGKALVYVAAFSIQSAWPAPSFVWLCSEDIDYLASSSWITGNYEYLNGWDPVDYTERSVDLWKLPHLLYDRRKVQFEKGDITYRELGDPDPDVGEWHTDLLGAVQVDGDYTMSIKTYSSHGCQDGGWFWETNWGSPCGGDAAYSVEMELGQYDPYQMSSWSHWENIEDARAGFPYENGEGIHNFMGVRTPTTYSLSKSDRNSIISSGAAVMNEYIEYTWSDMMENEWSWALYGWNYDWDGSAGDIDEIRCDGVAEYAYEHNGKRVWGHDGNWNAGSGCDDCLDDHNDLWEHIGYNLGEMSPVIQGGCGGNNNGARTTLRSRQLINKPFFGGIYANTSSSTSAYFELASLDDVESDYVYVELQYLGSQNQWRTAKSTSGAEIRGYYSVNAPFLIWYLQPNGSNYFLTSNQRWRVTLIDEGGNQVVEEYIGNRSLPTSGSHTYEYTAPYDGMYTFRLTGIPYGNDFDIRVEEHSYGSGTTLVSGTAGGNADEEITFYAGENAKLKIVVYAYSGAGTYRLTQSGIRKARIYKPGKFYLLRSGNSWITSVVPTNADWDEAEGWAVSFGSYQSGVDVDMKLTSGGTTTSASTGVYLWEHFMSPSDYDGQTLSAYAHANAGVTNIPVRFYMITGQALSRWETY